MTGLSLYSAGIFICILVMCISLSKTLECNTEQINDTAKVECTAAVYKGENCSETFLSKIYTHLYGQDDFPGRPSDFTLQPIQKYYQKYKKYYSGFIAAVKPPKSYDIVAVRGFQIDFSDDQDGLRCIVMEIINTTLSFIHRENDLRLNVQLYPLKENRDFTFTAFSLPTPKTEKEVQQRYGKSGSYGWGLGSASASWITTISYYVNTEERYIQSWYAPAPTVLNFTSYEISLSRISANEDTSTEDRTTRPPVLIHQTEYKYSNLVPGRYRVGISPHEDGTYPDCKCKNEFNLCVQCTKTITKVIDIPDGGVTSPVFPLTSSTQSTTLKLTIGITSSTQTTLADATRENVIVTSDEGQNAVLPSVLGVISFILVVLVVVGCYMFNKSRIRRMFDDTPDAPVKQGLNNQGYDSPAVSKNIRLNNNKGDYGQHIVTEKKVAIIAADDDEYHRKVVAAFATYLQIHCHCNVLYFPWNTVDDKFRWITNSVEQADFHIFIASESAFSQYNAWKHKKSTLSTDLFVPYLSSILNRFVSNPNFSHKFMFVKFDHSNDICIPEELCTSHYHLMKHFTELLSHIHGLNAFKDDLKKVDLPFDQDLMKTKEGRDLNTSINHALKAIRPKQSRLDSGYTSHNEYSSFDEQEWREVRQKYVFNEILQEKPQGEVFGAFLIDEESRSLMPGQGVEIASIAPAITIAEGRAGEQICVSANLPIHNSMAINKYGNQIEPNIHPSEIGDYTQRKESSSTNASRSRQEGQLNDVFIINQDEFMENGQQSSFVFLPPSPSMLDEDITTQYQYEIMQDINRSAHRSSRRQSEPDTISGYSV